VVKAILEHLGLPTTRPPLVPADGQRAYLVFPGSLEDLALYGVRATPNGL
jgi:hypothetical protein